MKTLQHIELPIPKEDIYKFHKLSHCPNNHGGFYYFLDTDRLMEYVKEKFPDKWKTAEKFVCRGFSLDADNNSINDEILLIYSRWKEVVNNGQMFPE